MEQQEQQKQQNQNQNQNQYFPSPLKVRANKLLEKTINNIAKEENLSKTHINEILQSIFSLIRDSIKDSKNISEIRIMNFGTFKMKPKQKEKFIKKYQKYETVT